MSRHGATDCSTQLDQQQKKPFQLVVVFMLIESYGVMSANMVLPHSLSTTIRRQKLAGFVATPSPHRRQPAHAATSVTESVPQISDCAVIYASTIAQPQLASMASSSTSTDSYKQASKRVRGTSRSPHAEDHRERLWTRRSKVKQACQRGSLIPVCEVPYKRQNSLWTSLVHGCEASVERVILKLCFCDHNHRQNITQNSQNKWLTQVGLQVGLNKVVDKMIFTDTFDFHSTLHILPPTNSRAVKNQLAIIAVQLVL